MKRLLLACAALASLAACSYTEEYRTHQNPNRDWNYRANDRSYNYYGGYGAYHDDSAVIHNDADWRNNGNDRGWRNNDRRN